MARPTSGVEWLDVGRQGLKREHLPWQWSDIAIGVAGRRACARTLARRPRALGRLAGARLRARHRPALGADPRGRHGHFHGSRAGERGGRPPAGRSCSWPRSTGCASGICPTMRSTPGRASGPSSTIRASARAGARGGLLSPPVVRDLPARGRERAAEPCCPRRAAPDRALASSTTAPRMPGTWPTGPSGCCWRRRRCGGMRIDALAILTLLAASFLLLRRCVALLVGGSARPGFRRLDHGQRPALWRRARRPRPGLRPEAAARCAPLVLNTNLHGTHHRHPNLPWIALPRGLPSTTAGTTPAATSLRPGGSCADPCRSRTRPPASAITELGPCP